MITLGGSTIAALGWHVVKSSGLEDKVDQALAVATLPGRETSVVTSSLRPAAPRNGVVTVALTATTETALVTARNALEAVINTGQAIELLSTRRPSQRLQVYVTAGPADYGQGPEFVAPYYLEIGLKVTAPFPWWEDSSDQTVNFTTSATAVPQGTADARGVITITASGSSVVNPTLTYKAGDGTTLVTLNPTITIADGDAWKIDSVTGQVRKRVSGTWSNAIATLPSGFTFPVFRRSHFTYGTNSPTLEVDAGNGSVVYRRAYG